MKQITIILLIGFVGMALFGFIGIGMSHHVSAHSSSDSDCLASFVVGNSVCPDGNDSFSHAFYHIQAYQFFSSTLISSVIVIVSILASVFLLAFAFKIFDAYFTSRSKTAYLRKRLTETIDSLHSSARNFIRWLSLLENSPSAI